MYIKFSLLNPKEILVYINTIKSIIHNKKSYSPAKYNRIRTNLIFRIVGLLIIQFSTFVIPITLIGYLTYNGISDKELTYTYKTYVSDIKDRKFFKNYKSFKGESLEGSNKFFYSIKDIKIKECVEEPNAFVEIKFTKKLWVKELPLFAKIVRECKSL